MRNLIHQHQIALCGLNETKIRSAWSISVAKNLLPGWKFLFNYSKHRLGRIWVAWDPSKITISLISTTDQVIHARVQLLDNQLSYLASFVYGLNDDNDRLPLWENLSNFSENVQSQPWIVIGDFNSVRFLSEKSGGNTSWTPAMDAFNKCCDSADIDDLKFVGHHLHGPTRTLLPQLSGS